jgi:hypothetical protein
MISIMVWSSGDVERKWGGGEEAGRSAVAESDPLANNRDGLGDEVYVKRSSKVDDAPSEQLVEPVDLLRMAVEAKDELGITGGNGEPSAPGEVHTRECAAWHKAPLIKISDQCERAAYGKAR